MPLCKQTFVEDTQGVVGATITLSLRKHGPSLIWCEVVPIRCDISLSNPEKGIPHKCSDHL